MTKPSRLSTALQGPAFAAALFLGPLAHTQAITGSGAIPDPSGRTVPAPNDSAPSARTAASALVFNPTIRVGLTADRARVVVSCSRPFRVTDSATGVPIWKDVYREALTLGIRGGKPTEGRTYRAQVASFTDKDAAERLATALRGKVADPVVVVWMPDRRAWRVRAGAGDTRTSLADLVTRLKGLGYDGIWIAEELVPQSVITSLVLVDENYDTMAVTAKAMLIEPAAAGDAPLGIEGVSYRGSIEVRLDSSGAIRVINAIPLETYLRGVVPAELGPSAYPEIEALKAQAIAARTYAYRNLGQFSDEGFDLCDTPRCQVYAGIKAEHPLSDRAIKETEGEVAIFDGQPIDALYTSTCGGHTEDASEIFPEDAAPYLTGVGCAPEERSRRKRRIVLDGARSLRDADPPAADAAALLAVHGLVPRLVLSPASLAAPVSIEEAESWIESLGAACGIARLDAGGAVSRTPEGHGRPPRVTAAWLARRLVERLGWGPRAELVVGRGGAQAWFSDEDTQPSAEEGNAVAYFIQQKGWPAGQAGRPDPARTASRGDLARLMFFAASACDLIETKDGTVRGGSGGLRISGIEDSAPSAVPPSALLFADFGGGPLAVARATVVPGDRVRYHLDAGASIDYLSILPGRRGTADDRFSGMSTWEVAYAAKDLARRLEDYVGPVGELVDLVPLRRGVSGRVTQIRIIGTAGEKTISGFNIRTALGLKENLFVIAVQKDRKRALRRVVFTGRGWGHGVGMCQIGAYGMALRGSDYREILTHYYSGIAIERLR